MSHFMLIFDTILYSLNVISPGDATFIDLHISVPVNEFFADRSPNTAQSVASSRVAPSTNPQTVRASVPPIIGHPSSMLFPGCNVSFLSTIVADFWITLKTERSLFNSSLSVS
jgi:hypothetical protein